MWKRWWSNRTSTHVGMMLVKRNFLRWWHDWWRTTGTSTKVNIKESEEFHFFGTGFHKNQPKNANLFNLFRCRYDASTLRRSLCEDERRCSIRVIAEYCRLHVIVWTRVATKKKSPSTFFGPKRGFSSTLPNLTKNSWKIHVFPWKWPFIFFFLVNDSQKRLFFPKKRKIGMFFTWLVFQISTIFP